jgi:uncharacterized membrane protein
MNWHPLLAAPRLWQVHAFVALFAFVLGFGQFVLPKGTLPHRVMGYVWVACMAVIALSSFGIQGLRPGSFSFVHVVSVYTLIMLPFAVLPARRGQVRGHAIAMISLFVGALVIAGAFTLVPGRIMHHVVFGALSRPGLLCG